MSSVMLRRPPGIRQPLLPVQVDQSTWQHQGVLPCNTGRGETGAAQNYYFDTELQQNVYTHYTHPSSRICELTSNMAADWSAA